MAWGYDKRVARVNGQRLENAHKTKESHRVPTRQRISEKKLLVLVVLGGGVGALLGMSFWRHKTSKGSFLWKVLLLLLMQCILIIYIFTSS